MTTLYVCKESSRSKIFSDKDVIQTIITDPSRIKTQLKLLKKKKKKPVERLDLDPDPHICSCAVLARVN